MKKFAFVSFLLFATLLLSAHASSVVPDANLYTGAYWTYPASNFQVTMVNTAVYSCSLGSSTGYAWTLLWGDNSQNSGFLTSGYIYVNTNVAEGGGQRCNIGYTAIASGSGPDGTDPAVGFSSNGNPDYSFYHNYFTNGGYQLELEPTTGGDSFATLYVIEPVTVASYSLFAYSGSFTSIDLGDSFLIAGHVYCGGSSTYCANVSYDNFHSGIVGGDYQFNNVYTPTQSGSNSLTVCGYDPVAASNVCGSAMTYNVFTDIQAPATTFTANQYTFLSYSYNVIVPVQLSGSNKEGNPQGSINFNDGTGSHTLSFSTSGGNYIATISHTFSSAGSYNAVINMISYNYANSEGISTSGSTSSNSLVVNVQKYTPPSFNSLTPRNVLELTPINFVVSAFQGNYPIKNYTIIWNDGSHSTVTTNALSATMAHTEGYQGGGNTVVHFQVSICDVNGACNNTIQVVGASYNLANVISITPSNTIYSLVKYSYTFNIIQGSYPVKNVEVNWGDGNSVTLSTNSLSPAFNHTYASAGTFKITGIALDNNTEPSSPFSQNVIVNQYIFPSISQLSPTSVSAGNSVIYYYRITPGTFPIANSNPVSLSFGIGNTIFPANVITGTNNVPFTYSINGNFTSIEKVTDKNGFSNQNITLISVSPYPWNFSTPKPIINYNITNVTATAYVQTNETDILPINYSVQQNNIANDYICSTTMSSNGLFAVRCVTNPDAIQYVNQTLLVTIFARDSVGVIKSVGEQINLFPKVPPPPTPEAPFSHNTVAPPLQSAPFAPVSAWIIIAVVSIVVVSSTIGWLYVKRNDR